RLFEITAVFPGEFRFIGKPKKNRCYLVFEFRDGLPETISVTAQWWSIDTLRKMQNAGAEPVGPIGMFFNEKTQKTFVAYLFAPPVVNPTHFIVLSAGPAHTPGNAQSPSLIFLGGWVNERPQLVGMFPDYNQQRTITERGSLKYGV